MFARLSQSRTTPRRAAFSLIELLVVIAIMAILSGLAFALLGQSGQAAREAATQGGILAIHSTLEDRMRGFDRITQQLALADPDLPMKPELRAFRKRTLEFMTLYNNPASPTPTPNPQVGQADAELYVRKALFKAAFPQREKDLWGMDGLSDFETVPYSYVDDSPLLSRMWDSANSTWYATSWKAQDLAARATLPTDVTADDLAESAELLYLVLTEGDVFDFSPANLDGIDQNLIGDTDGDDNLELLDGWGKPLQFYNWPTRLFKADGATYVATDYTQASVLVSGLPPLSAPAAQLAMMNRDPMDNASRLTRMRDRQSQPRWFTADFKLGSRTNFGQLLGPEWFHDRDCYFVTLLVSAGADGALGMERPNSITSTSSHLGLVTSAEELGDNLSNRQKGPK